MRVKLNMALYAIPIMQHLHQFDSFSAFEIGKAITSLITFPKASGSA